MICLFPTVVTSLPVSSCHYQLTLIGAFVQPRGSHMTQSIIFDSCLQCLIYADRHMLTPAGSLPTVAQLRLLIVQVSDSNLHLSRHDTMVKCWVKDCTNEGASVWSI